MRTQSRATESVKFTNLNGGLATRPAPLVIEAGSKKKMMSPALRNVDYFQSGAISKRLGKTIQGNALVNSSFASQATSDTSGDVNSTWTEQLLYDATRSANAPSASTGAFCQKIIASFTATISTIDAYISSSEATSSGRITIRADSAGNPGAVVTNGTSDSITLDVSTTPSLETFTFSTPPTVTSGTTYWVCVEYPVSLTILGYLNTNGSGSSGRLKITSNNFSSFTTSAWDDIYFKIISSPTGLSTTAAICQKVNAGASTSIASMTVYASTTTGATQLTGKVTIRSDSSGPGSVITNGTSNTQLVTVSATPQLTTFTWAIPPSVTSGVDYWFCLEVVTVSEKVKLLTKGAGAASSGRVKITMNNYSAIDTDSLNDIYYAITSTGNSANPQGIYDYRIGNSTQRIVVAAGGVLYYHARNATPLTGDWTSFTTGLGSGQDVLFSFATLKDYMYATDYGNNVSRAWDQSSTGTIKGGYRLTPWYTSSYTELSITSTAGSTLTMAANQAANGLYVGKYIYLTGSATISPQFMSIKAFTTTGTAGTSTYYVTAIELTDKPYTDHTKVRFNGATITVNNAAGSINTSGALTCFSILAITSLKSGGFRCSEFSADTEAGNTSQIEFTNIAMNSSTDGTGFGFDIADKATEWYMSAAFNPGANAGATPTITYYKILVGNISTGTNPNTNATTAFNITAITNLTTGASLLDTYELEDSYFLSQRDMPKAKYFATFQNALFSAGDPSNPTRLWISETDAPQIWSVEGGLQGSYLEIGIGGDNDIITGLFAFNEYLYVFKRHSVYILVDTGNSQVPYRVQRIAADIGCLSHWSVKAISNSRFVFISERGPAMCYGTTVAIVPSAVNILDRFDPNNTSRYNLAAMQYTTAGVNATKFQVWWGVSSTSATTRDLTLVYDYENDAFYEHDIQANFYAEVTDGNNFPSIWSGDYSARVFQHESGLTDNGSAISFYFESPNIQFGDPFSWKHVDQLFVAGTVQASGTLTVDLYADFATSVTKTVTFDMTASKFKTGSYVPVGLRCKALRAKFSNSEISVPVQIDAFGFGYQDRGTSV